MFAALLGGCISAPADPVTEKLDQDTATTVVVLDKPLELFDINGRARDRMGEAFAYLAPFETDRMGSRALFLWVSAPRPIGTVTQQPKVWCNDQTLVLDPVGPEVVKTDATGVQKVDLSSMNLSKSPYDPPVPWNGQWYFKLRAEDLKCLGEANAISIETDYANGEDHRYTGDHKDFAPLTTFANNHR
jgi:hypothetical protein